MGAGQAAAIRDALLANGRSPATPVAIVRNASLPDASTRRGTLGDLPALCASDDAVAAAQPAMILLGDAFAVEHVERAGHVERATPEAPPGIQTSAQVRRYA